MSLNNEELQAALVASGFVPGPGRVGTAETLAARLRYRRPAGECPTCDHYRNDDMMPSHTASDRCESGKRNHCTCDTCF